MAFLKKAVKCKTYFEKNPLNSDKPLQRNQWPEIVWTVWTIVSFFLKFHLDTIFIDKTAHCFKKGQDWI